MFPLETHCTNQVPRSVSDPGAERIGIYRGINEVESLVAVAAPVTVICCNARLAQRRTSSGSNQDPVVTHLEREERDPHHCVTSAAK